MKKIQNILILLPLVILLSLSGCIYETVNTERPKTITIKGYIMIDEDGLGIGKPPVPATDLEEYFVIYTKNSIRQPIINDISEFPLVKDYLQNAVSQGAPSDSLPQGMKVYTREDKTANTDYISEDGYFEIEIDIDGHTVWAGIPGENYEVNFIDLTGQLKIGEIMDSLEQINGRENTAEDDRLEIVLVPNKNGVTRLWLGPDDVGKYGKYTTQDLSSGERVNFRTDAMGWAKWENPNAMATAWEMNDLYYYFDLKASPGTYEFGWVIGENDDDAKWHLATRGDNVGVQLSIDQTINAKIDVVGKPGKKYTPTIANLKVSGESNYYIKNNLNDSFQAELSVYANYIKIDSTTEGENRDTGVKSVSGDFSSLGFSEDIVFNKVVTEKKSKNADGTERVEYEFIYKTEELKLPEILLTGDYEVKIKAIDNNGGIAEQIESLKISSRPIIDENKILISPSSILVGKSKKIEIEIPVIEESSMDFTIKTTLPNGDVINLYDNGFGNDKIAGDKIYTIPDYTLLNLNTGTYKIKIEAENIIGEKAVYITDFEVLSEKAKVQFDYIGTVVGDIELKLFDVFGKELEIIELSKTTAAYSTGEIEIEANDYLYNYFINGEQVFADPTPITKEKLISTIGSLKIEKTEDRVYFKDEGAAITSLTINFINGEEGVWALNGELPNGLSSMDIVFDAQGKATLIFSKADLATINTNAWEDELELDLKFQTMPSANNSNMGSHGVDVSEIMVGTVTIDLSVEDQKVKPIIE